MGGQIAAIFAVLSVLAINGCYSQEEINTELAMATMVNDEGHMWWDPSAKTSAQIHEGDMTTLRFSNKEREKRGAIRNRFFLWPHAAIPFIIASTFSSGERTTIIESMKHWEENTCLRFIPRTTQRDYVTFFRGNGCQSYVGRVRGEQGISLGFNCVHPSTILHQIGHAVGFFHEHNRPDRDDYVRIITSNIRPGAEDQFRKKSKSQVNSLGVGYDYNSIMHYDPDTFGRRGRIVIEALDRNIIVGNAEELSPSDILQTERLYRCDQIGNRPSQLVLPPTPPLALPNGIQCGRVFTSKFGAFTSPGYPSFRHNQSCAWVISAPEGYEVLLTIRGLSVDVNQGCTKDYIQIHSGRVMGNAIQYFGYTEGRICDRLGSFQSITFPISSNEVVVYYQTDGSNTAGGLKGFQASFQVNDINECRTSDCHNCVNTEGSFQCSCNEGYYLSPAARKCFDVNECALVNGCDTCINTAGSYSCSCGGRFTIASGSLQSSNWPETYNVNETCEWIIELPDPNSVIRISFDDQAFGIGGSTPCPKDVLEIFDGLDDNAYKFNSICGVDLPDPITTTSNAVRIVFTSGPIHGSKRNGFRINYDSVAALPLTILQTSPECENFTTVEDDNIIKTPNWPQTYPVNLHCEWLITLADPNKVIDMSFDPQFGIAGRTDQNCPKDKLTIYDGHDDDAVAFGTFCEFNIPPTMRTSSNKAKITFTALRSHGANRVGFKATLSAFEQ